MQDISHTTTYDSFAKRWGQDARIQSLERKDRESLLNDRFVEVFPQIIFAELGSITVCTLASVSSRKQPSLSMTR